MFKINYLQYEYIELSNNRYYYKLIFLMNEQKMNKYFYQIDEIKKKTAKKFKSRINKFYLRIYTIDIYFNQPSFFLWKTKKIS